MFQTIQLHKQDKNYPALLRETSDVPERLFVRGNVDVFQSQYPVAVVGTRRYSAYGKEVAEQFIHGLNVHGMCVVSGLAFGIDSIAHTLAVQNNTPTIAVLGSAVEDDDIYPRQNLNLARKILENGGALVSEYEAGSTTYPSNFLQRNRIIAGLSLGTLIVEAPQKSGALSTAKHALEANRSVYAVPNAISSVLSKGTNNLIKQGAFCVTNPQDILDDLGIQKNNTKENNVILSTQEKTILEMIQTSPAPIHIDDIVEKSNVDITIISSIMVSLVLHNLIKEIEANTYYTL